MKLVEVSPRDGLQNKIRYLTVEGKISLIHSIEKAGFKEIEVTSFVNPDFVPQVKDAEELVYKLTKTNNNVCYSALVPMNWHYIFMIPKEWPRSMYFLRIKKG